MEDFESSKREQYNIERLSNPTFEDLEGKWKALDDIQKARNGLMQELATNDSAAERQAIHNVLYELKTAKHNVETRMANIARGRRG